MGAKTRAQVIPHNAKVNGLVMMNQKYQLYTWKKVCDYNIPIIKDMNQDMQPNVSLY
jgi:hypothetical protein